MPLCDTASICCRPYATLDAVPAGRTLDLRGTPACRACDDRYGLLSERASSKKCPNTLCVKHCKKFHRSVLGVPPEEGGEPWRYGGVYVGCNLDSHLYKGELDSNVAPSPSAKLANTRMKTE